MKLGVAIFVATHKVARLGARLVVELVREG